MNPRSVLRVAFATAELSESDSTAEVVNSGIKLLNAQLVQVSGLRSSVKAEVDVLVSPSLTVIMVSVDLKRL